MAIAAACRTRSGNERKLSFVGVYDVTPSDLYGAPVFDNCYFKNILVSKGILNPDEVLFTKSKALADLVKKYAESIEVFFEQFGKSMIKMGNISPTGSKGEGRKNCRRVN
ncbi:hypothetical protein Sjap_007893 [Stephania japonica]|uniref:Plant heme peroxidase family profile domain-containing protein n=1 Tax=Stephania japonica TaxID=461633 RepID=A0AAP0JP31_9MAGN